MELSEFETELAALIGRPSNLRPFVCSGNPLDCRAFIVGFNPASRLERARFWDYWSGATGFAKSRWLEAYIAERLARGIEQGKKKRRFSTTRSRIEIIVREAHPARFVETNVYSHATSQAADLERAARDTSVLEFLLGAIRPELLVVHGAETREVLEQLSVWRELNAETWFFPHLASRNGAWTNEKAAAIGRRARATILSGQ